MNHTEDNLLAWCIIKVKGQKVNVKVQSWVKIAQCIFAWQTDGDHLFTQLLPQNLSQYSTCSCGSLCDIVGISEEHRGFNMVSEVTQYQLVKKEWNYHNFFKSI